MPLILLIGGARSGKSALALQLARQQEAPVVFIATGEAGDREMAERIDRHRRERPGGWQTLEEPLDLRAALASVAVTSCLVLDCLTLWAANALEAFGAGEAESVARVVALAAAARSGPTIVVTNEVGLGIVPGTPLGRSYRDLLGRVNTIWAEAADHVLLLVAGRALPLERAEELATRLL
jgi:adenosyl cobinamide kinase/adenosyl cobinamide phosphate guanylyltransferase